MVIDIHSPTWKAVEEWADRRLMQHRSRLESISTDDRSTMLARGACVEIKALLALAKPRDPAELPAAQQPAGI